MLNRLLQTARRMWYVNPGSWIFTLLIYPVVLLVMYLDTRGRLPFGWFLFAFLGSIPFTILLMHLRNLFVRWMDRRIKNVFRIKNG